MTASPPWRCVLTIAGSDSGGGAGVQADLKTFAAHGLHGLSAIAALTAQNTRAVTAVHTPPADFLRAQIDAVFDDFDIGAVKLGMLASAELIETVAAALSHYRPDNIVLDPVMVASSGARLLDPAALDALRRLLPMATVITPNIPEAELLVGHAIADHDQAEQALDELTTLGAGAVLLKGGHLPGDPVIDRLSEGGRAHRFRHPRLMVDGHGSGCTLASAIAANLCQGLPLAAACEQAGHYLHGALAAAYRPGRSAISVLDPFWRNAPAGGIR
jgi:hydroxymethylpyrimidine/phosphomethylpyrimidine kinase